MTAEPASPDRENDTTSNNSGAEEELTAKD
jgi:hypothetical protein